MPEILLQTKHAAQSLKKKEKKKPLSQLQQQKYESKSNRLPSW